MKCLHVVAEDDDAIAAALVVLDQELTGVELHGIHHVEMPLAPNARINGGSAEDDDRRYLRLALRVEIFPIELLGHRTPDFGALHVGNVPALLPAYQRVNRGYIAAVRRKERTNPAN